MSFGAGALDSGRRTRFPQGEDARTRGVVHLADPEDLQPVEMADDAGRLDEGADVRDAPEDAIRPERPAKKLDVADAVQQGTTKVSAPRAGRSVSAAASQS